MVRQPPRRRLEIDVVALAEDVTLALVTPPSGVDLGEPLRSPDDLDAVMPAPAAQLGEAGEVARQ